MVSWGSTQFAFSSSVSWWFSQEPIICICRMSITETNWNIWLLDWDYLKYYGGDGREGCKNLDSRFGTRLNNSFSMSKPRETLQCSAILMLFRKQESHSFSGQNKAYEFISLCQDGPWDLKFCLGRNVVGKVAAFRNKVTFKMLSFPP